MQSGRQPWVQQSLRDIEKLTGISRSFVQRIVGLDNLRDRVCTYWASLDQQVVSKAIDQWRPWLKAVVSSSRRAHWTVVYLTVCCCMLLLLGYACIAVVFCHCDIVMLGCFDSVVIFWTTCWHTNLVWALIYVRHNFSSYGMLFVNVNKYSSTINRRI